MTDPQPTNQSDDQPDNLTAAIDKLAETLEPTLPNPVGTPDKPAQKQVLIRATEHEHTRWKQAAQHTGTTMSDYIRTTVNERTAELLDCTHPLTHRRAYPWAEFCTNCNQRLRG